MASRDDLVVVGTYPSDDEARRAQGHLRDEHIGDVGIEQLSSDAWQVEVPIDQQARALEALERMEQKDIGRFF